MTDFVAKAMPPADPVIAVPRELLAVVAAASAPITGAVGGIDARSGLRGERSDTSSSDHPVTILKP